MRRHRQEMGPLTEINVTNLLDTCFVLLMAFMVVAPAMQTGIQLDLPEVENSQALGAEDAKKTVTVAVSKPLYEGASWRILVQEDKERLVDLAQLADHIKTSMAKHPKLDVIMQVDKAAPFQTFAEALSVIKAEGIENVGIMTVPPGDEDDKAAAKPAPPKTEPAAAPAPEEPLETPNP